MDNSPDADPVTEARRRRGRLFVALVAIGTMLAASACGIFEEQEWMAPCAVIVDASGSGDEFHVDERLNETLEPFLVDQRCGRLAFVPLNSLSDTSACTEKPLQLDPGVGDPEEARKAVRPQATERALRLLECARQEPHDSDVLGALRQAADARPTGGGTYHVLIVSDMIQIDDRVNMLRRDLGTQPARAELAAEIADLTPNLHDTVLYPTDLGANIADATLGQNVKAFWTELFATDITGHPTVELTYV